MLTVWLEPKRLAFLNHAQVNFMLTVWLQPSGQYAFMDRYTNPPASGPGLGRRRGCSALDKVLENCYHKNRKSAVTSGWLY